MAHEEKGSTSRRSILQVGAVALGAALMPRAAGAAPTGALEQLRAEYRNRINALAEELEPRFRSGELRGFRDGDGDLFNTREGRHPRWALEDECCRRLAATHAEAYVVLACSPYSIATEDNWNDTRRHAAAAASFDVFKVALDRGSYQPDESMEEAPSAETLRTAHLEQSEPLEEVEAEYMAHAERRSARAEEVES